MNNVWETDRSTILDGQSCPRKRFLGRHLNGRGIQKIRKSLPLAFGGAFHEGAEELLLGHGVEAAVTRAVTYLDAKFAEAGIELDSEDVAAEKLDAMTAHSVAEQKAIAEGLLRAWWLVKGEQFLADFEVLEVEQEGRAELGEGVVLMFRPDALVRERATGDLYVVSWKTASTFGKWTVNGMSTDMQSMSEVWGVQNSAGASNIGNVGPEPIEGVLYLIAVKGQRRMDNWLGFKTQSTPLAYAWMRPGPTDEDTEWAHSYSFTTDDGRNTKLGKGFRKVSVWDNYPGGVKAWVEALAEQEITPRHENVLEEIFPQMMPVSRRADEIESWRRQTVAAESRWRDAEREVRIDRILPSMSDFPNVLDRNFPQHTARCFDYASKCQFFDICWSPSVKDDPLGSGLYSIRVANHPEKGGEGDE